MQIDESVTVRAKYHHGQQLRERQQWVFGIYDPQLKEGYIQLMEQCDAATLLPIIQQILTPGTTIWPDEQAAYRQLASLGYTHETVKQ